MERLTYKEGNHYYSKNDCLVEISTIDEDSLNVLQNILDKLGTYEDAEEQGLLLRLPCKVGSNIYRITDDGVDTAECREIRVADKEMYIESVTLCDWISFDEIGKTVFLTEEEAEAKLAEMEGADPYRESEVDHGEV